MVASRSGQSENKFKGIRPGLYMALLLLPLLAGAQHDTLWTRNGNVLYGEVKILTFGVLTLETDYSDSDFKIEFEDVVRLSIERECRITLTGGRRLFGQVRSENPGSFTLLPDEGDPEAFPLEMISNIYPLKDQLIKRFTGNVDIGFTLTKAKNLRQFDVGGGVHYRGMFWQSDWDISSMISNQDSVELVQRTNSTLAVLRLIGERWFLYSSASFLTNTEQALDRRIGLHLAGGNYLVLTNKMVLGLMFGFNHNTERFAYETENRRSVELYLSSSLKLFDVKDFKLNTRIDLYPSLSEKRRVRADYVLDAKLDLPLDFYLKCGFQFNYDNQSAVAGSAFDYIFTSGLGWEFD